MGENERCARFHAAANLAQGVEPLLARDEVKHNEARRRIERTFRRGVDIAFGQDDAIKVLCRSLAREGKHVGGEVKGRAEEICSARSACAWRR